MLKQYFNNVYKICKINIFIFVFIISFSSVQATCSDIPDDIMIYSGSYDLGVFNASYFDSGNFAYVKGNISKYPIKVELSFDTSGEDDCFSQNSDVTLNVLNSLFEASSFTVNNNKTVFEVNVILPIIVSSAFEGRYVTKNKNYPGGTNKGINFRIDDDAPILVLNKVVPSIEFDDQFVSPNTEIKINFTVKDSGSSLDSLRVSGTDIVKIYDFRKESDSGFIQEVLTSSKTYTFTIKDKLGFETVEEITFNIDSGLPQIIDLENTGYFVNEQNERFVSFGAVLEDDSFTSDPSFYEDDIWGDFSFINVNHAKTNPDECFDKSDLSDNQIYCRWAGIEITAFDSTKNVNVKIGATDVVGNDNNKSFNVEVFYDSTPPEIKDFYLLNNVGKKDIFSVVDTNATIVLKVSDDSMEDDEDITIITDFDVIDFDAAVSFSRNMTGNILVNTWELKNSLERYGGTKKGDLMFKILVSDKFDNLVTKELNITYDNLKPNISDIKLFETTSIKDSVVNSGEDIYFTITVQDDNLVFEEDFIYGDFSSIDYRDGQNRVRGACEEDSDLDNTYICEFTGITVENGYMMRNVSFYVIDEAGNVNVENFEVEVLKIGDEVRDVFKIVDTNTQSPDFENNKTKYMYILNPVGRGHILQSSAIGWFTGEIELQSDYDSDFKVISYELKGCNESELLPLILNDNILYPQSAVVKGYDDIEADKKFVLRAELRSHQTRGDLLDDTVTCQMAILKRDNSTLYGVTTDTIEIVDFKIKFSYFDLPNENLLGREINNILEVIDDANKLTASVDDIYEKYTYVKDVCTVVNTATSTMATVWNVWVPISSGLHAFKATEGAAAAVDAVLLPSDGTLSMITNHNPVIKEFCNFVTCDMGFQKDLTKIYSLGMDDLINNRAERFICGSPRSVENAKE